MPCVQPVGFNDNEGCTFVNIVSLWSLLPIQCKDRIVGSSWKVIVCFRTNRPTRKVHPHINLSRQTWIDYSPCYVRGKIGQWEKTFALCHDWQWNSLFVCAPEKKTITTVAVSVAEVSLLLERSRLKWHLLFFLFCPETLCQQLDEQAGDHVGMELVFIVK